MKHTPGPWEIQRTSALSIYVTQPHDKPDRTPGYYAEIRRFTSDVEQVEANARLIAAAPELLEILMELQDIVFLTRNNELHTLMEAAITKAKGDQHANTR
jgi:hypothetical protein